LKKYLIEDENDPDSENDFGNNIIPNLFISSHNNAPPRMAGQGVMCHGWHIKANYIIFVLITTMNH
ncbi:hypothetical protein, partial [Agathobacter rectalis]|uniref:hypothetical protein n=1 Tax=Agathobacter rectalis TaxID=39491 RepID=UPI0027D327D5